jgi:predicted RNase H-like HicB family nuclease
MPPYHVTAEWDAEGRVWIASSEEVPGLATGADTFQTLVEKLKVAVPELLAENGFVPATTRSVPFEIRIRSTK